jgi:hypothetical protein
MVISKNVASLIFILISLIKKERYAFFHFEVDNKKGRFHQYTVVPTGKSTLFVRFQETELCICMLLVMFFLNASTKTLPHLHVKSVPTQNTPKVNEILKLRIYLC